MSIHGKKQNTSGALFARKKSRWNQESFLNAACTVMTQELDWDSLDAGRLHQSSSKAKTLNGEHVIIAVTDRSSVIDAVLDDANEERQHVGIPKASLWLYIPEEMVLSETLNESVVIRRIAVTNYRNDRQMKDDC